MHTFCWVDLHTLDAAGANEFYGQLFDWSVADSLGASGRPYSLLSYRGKKVGGLFEMPAEMRARGMPPHWTSYVAVESADATAERAEELGGSIVCVIDAGQGRMAILKDPTGAAFALWEQGRPGSSQREAELREAPNSNCWQELMTSDGAEARKFYTALFGWVSEVEKLGSLVYTTFKQANKAVGGMVGMPGHVSGRSHWNTYFAVNDCDFAVWKAQSLGGQRVGGPFDFPGVGRSAVLQDPQGATFCVIKRD